ncbi:cytochrome c-type biogenesis protein [Breoghania sp. L-A4]|uniref:cytochrome c-type biogenesis protein n=1 Tax=Breoghania sp. L-A4 TaxID=2304600 RepID=UPI000E35AEB3|nr:cytochrome c-type biogenesis protein [Breoghania sp. L-A4]AXS39982.1 cytochrome c-type biogenesis protein CcmH [Breoghania sp. L-A4]
MRRALSTFTVALVLTLATAGAMTLLCAGPALAVQPDEVLSDPVLEHRARALSKELRCMVCQNQSIDDSDAPLARDLRILVRERLKEGDSDGEVIDYLVDRYGEFVLLKPRFALHTLALWLGAPLALLLGGFLVFRASRNKAAARSAGVEPLSEAEQAELKRVMEG